MFIHILHVQCAHVFLYEQTDEPFRNYLQHFTHLFIQLKYNISNGTVYLILICLLNCIDIFGYKRYKYSIYKHGK